MADILKVVNTIIENDLDKRIPQATKENFTTVGETILSYQATTNAFVSALVNKIAFTMVQYKAYNNPLRELKKGAKPFGKDIENVHVNPAKGEKFDIDKGTELLKVTRPDVASEYFRLNRQDQYTVSVNRQQLKHGFTSLNAMEDLIEGIKASLLSGDNIDEFILMKKLYSDAISNDRLNYVVADTTDTKSLLKDMKLLSSAYKFPNTEYASWNKINKAEIKSGSKTARVTWSPLENQVILIRSDVLIDIDLNVLAGAFNMSKAELESRIIEVDTFGSKIQTKDGKNVEPLAVIQDVALTQVWEDMSEMTEFFNAKNLTYNFYWNHWQTMGISTLCNGTALVKEIV